MAEADDRRALILKLWGAAGKVPAESVLEATLTTLAKMPTPRLMRVVDQVLEGIQDLTNPEDFRAPTAGALWALSRKIRALPAPPLTLDEMPREKPFDGWTRNANFLLLAYITDTGARRGDHLAPDSTTDPITATLRFGPRTTHRTGILVKWKDIWASDMRRDREKGGKLDGKPLWAECMQAAESEIDQFAACEQAAA